MLSMTDCSESLGECFPYLCAQLRPKMLARQSCRCLSQMLVHTSDHPVWPGWSVVPQTLQGLQRHESG